MIVDNILINAIVNQIKEPLINQRIDKIHQVSKYNFVFNLRNKSIKKSLLISLSHDNYRVHFTKKYYEKPKTNSAIGIQLKKHLEGSTILSVKQINFDRIIEFKLLSFDNVKDRVIRYLIVELTGKYSNLIFTNEEKVIIGCYKEINEHQSEERQIYLNSHYEPITNKKNKLSIFEITKKHFFDLIDKNKELISSKFLIQNFWGISSKTANRIIETNKILSEYTEKEKSQLFNKFKKISEKIKNNEYNIFIKNENGKLDFEFLTEKNTLDISDEFDNHYLELERKQGFNKIFNEINKFVYKQIKKIIKKIELEKKLLEKSKKANELKEKGDLLLTYIYNLENFKEEVIVENYFDNNKLIKIDLEKELTIKENAKKYLKRYSKQKKAKSAKENLILKLEKELYYFQEIEVSLNNSTDINNLYEIGFEIEKGDYPFKLSKNINKRNKKEKVIDKLLRVISPDGFDIFVGKNNLQNEFISTKLANKNDIWLHARLIPGSHVLIRTDDGKKEVSDTTLETAANLAAKYSKSKNSSNVCVIYTKAKYLKKPPGSKPGYVTYSKEKAIYITPI